MIKKKKSIAIFPADLEKMKAFYAKHPEFKSLADAEKVVVEYADAHGVFK